MGSRRLNSTVSSSAAPATPPPHPAVYPTVSPETVIVPIVSSIVLFPAAVLVIIFCLRRRAERARRRIKRRRYISFRDRGDMHRRKIPIIRIHGQRRDFPGGRHAGREDRCSRLRELHYSTASVFQAVLGIDLDLDDRSDRDSGIVGYTSLRPASPSSSSTNSLRVCRRSSRPQIIQMEMSPRVPRSSRACRAATLAQPAGDTYRRLGDNSTDIFRRPEEASSQPDATQPSNSAVILELPERNGVAIARSPENGDAIARSPENGDANARSPERGDSAILWLPEQGGGPAILRCSERHTSDICRRPAEAGEVSEVSNGVQYSGAGGGKMNGVGGADCGATVGHVVNSAIYVDDPGTAC